MSHDGIRAQIQFDDGEPSVVTPLAGPQARMHFVLATIEYFWRRIGKCDAAFLGRPDHRLKIVMSR